jgi:hypothetical protein
VTDEPKIVGSPIPNVLPFSTQLGEMSSIYPELAIIFAIALQNPYAKTA